ncbi:MAG TPA: type IV pilus assembly protein PilM [Phycisphaerales bacterium]|nr:type IV pilus assembly protein PilM [Phycisphaerales bacterium]
MATSNACWGIEVGAAAVKAVKLEAGGEGRCRLADWAFIPHPKVLSTPGVDPNDVIRVSLGTLASQVDLSKAAVAISVPGHSSFARFAKLPPVEPKKVASIIEFEAKQQIPFPLEEVEWDYQTFVTPDSPELEVGIFAVTKDRIAERLTMLEDVGIVPHHVVLSPIAVYNALAYDLDFNQQTPGTIIVDIGTTSTDLVIATPGRMWVRTFPLGGHNFTEALVSQFQLSYAKAEKLKREAQDTKHARQVFQAMRPVFTDLAQDIQRSIGYFQSLNRDAKLTRVIGVGETWRLPGLRKYLKQQLGLDVYRIESFKRIGTGGAGIEGAEDNEDGGQQQAADAGDRNAQFNNASLAMATAYGLALHGLGLNAVSGNLMPVATIRRTMWKEKAKYFGVAAGIAAAAGGVFFLNAARAHFAVAGTTPDPSIAMAVNRANDIKRQADEAGVTNAGEPDMRAANIASLVQGRDLYPSIMRDVQAIFAAADARLATWGRTIQAPGGAEVAMPPAPALDLDSIQTEYYPPVTPESGGQSPLPADLAQYPAIEVVVQVNTNVPEPRRFLEDTVARWLRENGKRPGVPYQIVFAERETVFRSDAGETTSGTGQAPPRGQQPGATIRPGGARTEPDRASGGRSGPRGASPANPGGGRTGTRQTGVAPPVVVGEERGVSSAGPGAGVDAIAPIQTPETAMKKTGTGMYIWYVVLVPPAPATPADGVPAEAGAPVGGGS